MKKDTTEASSNFKAKLKIGSEERIGQQFLSWNKDKFEFLVYVYTPKKDAKAMCELFVFC